MMLSNLFARRVAFPIKERLTHKRSLETLQELERTQWLSSEEIRALQWERLTVLLRHAHETVPYYRSLFARTGIAPDEIRGFEDFSRVVPCLSKADLQREGDTLRSERPGPYPQRSRTSGSTGMPTNIWGDAVSSSYGYVAGLRGRRWWGVDICAPELKFWGVSAPFEGSIRGRIRSHGKWMKDRLLGTRVFSPFDLSEDRLRSIHAYALRRRPELVFGYGVAIYLFARFLKDEGISLSGWRPKAVIYTSESLLSSQKELIREVFRAPVVSEYGCVEAGAMGYECRHGRVHLSEDIAYFEIEPVGGGNGSWGELVVTPLWNLTFPLIRYRLGDLVEAAPGECPCGRKLRGLRRIVGRDNDLIRRPDGRFVHAELFDYIMRGQPGVRRYRILQRRLEVLEVFLETDGPLPEERLQRLREMLARHVGEMFFFDIRAVDVIPNDPSGKFRWVISEVKP